ncbi:MAG: alkaline phosphatase [Bacteroidales bacterium]|nr:alkaline phosphatase [Bacteroidales bacterium]
MKIIYLFLGMLMVAIPLSAQDSPNEKEFNYVGHRGASYLAPENTMASIQLAWELGADAAECDVMLTKDNRVILFHDKNAKKLTGENLIINETSWEQLSKLFIKLNDSNLKQYENEPIPLLKDVLGTIPADRMLVIEIKTGPEILPHLQQVIDKYWESGRISFIAFDFETIKATKELYPEIPCYYLSSFKPDLKKHFDAVVDNKLDGVDLRHAIIDRKTVEKCNAAGLDVWCWTVNDPETAMKMKEMGVTAVTTDRPGWLKEKLNENEKPERPTNIIFLIGDGMGLSAVSTTVYFGDLFSEFSRFKHIGLINTSSATDKITDSAASGTAMAAGEKTYNGAIGVDTARLSIQNIVEVVAELGWSTGVVATSAITHATPASFYAHVELRNMEEKIAVQLLDSDIDFFAGGGIKFFNQRSDGADLFKSAEAKGFNVDTTGLTDPATLSPDHKYGFVLAEGGMPPMLEGRDSFLPDATGLAIDYLSKNKRGFFLMVEGSQIDWAGHANSTEYLVSEMLDFEQVIAVAMDFAEKDGNTLVVVCADHETGGFTLSPEHDEETGHDNYKNIGPSFATGSHSATLIPVFAYGPGAEDFTGIYQNTEIFHKMVASIRKAD